MKQRGFTLIEMMVVVAIIGIVVSALSLTAFSQSNGLTADAQRLAQLLRVAQSEALADGRPITWKSSPEGYQFERRRRQMQDSVPLPTRLTNARPDVFATDEMLRPRRWSSPPVAVSVVPSGPIVLPAEWITGPLLITLSSDEGQVRIIRDAGGHYAVE